MKYFLLVGGFCGFVIVFASGIAAGNDFSDVLRNAAVGCLAGAFLMRGFRMLLTYQLRQVTAQTEEPSLGAQGTVAASK